MSIDWVKFKQVGFPAIAIAAGVITKRMSATEGDHLSDSQREVMESSGMTLFVGGWMYLAWTLWNSDRVVREESWVSRNQHAITAGACIGILCSVVLVMLETSKLRALEGPGEANANADGRDGEKWEILQRINILKVGFVVGWFALGQGMSVGKDPALQWLAVAAAALAVGSMMFVLPWQREVGETDGPGHTMLTLALAMFAVLNSMPVTTAVQP